MYPLIERLVNTQRALGVVRRTRRIFHRDPRYIVISAMPKSGSTFLSNALVSVTGFEHGYAAFAYGNIEQEIYQPHLIDMYGRGVVIQQHFKANRANTDLLRRFGVPTVVQVRNLFDAIVSLRDHLMSENLHNIPALYPSSRFRDFAAERQFDFLVDTAAPWYLSYYASWYAASAAGDVDTHWVVYEDARADWARAVGGVLAFHGMDADSERIQGAVNKLLGQPKSETRMNVGVVGRGHQQLTSEQRQRISRMAGYYPDVDFSRIGIEAA